MGNGIFNLPTCYSMCEPNHSHFNLQLRLSSDDNHSIMIKNLDPYTEYTFQIRCSFYNKVSDWSEEVVATTKESGEYIEKQIFRVKISDEYHDEYTYTVVYMFM